MDDNGAFPVPVYRRIVTAPVRFWSRWISPGLAPRCKYEPSCSRYATQAVEELGVFRGGVLTVWRLLRCNPFSHGGVDRVSDRTLFRSSGNAAGKADRAVHNL